MGSLLSTYHILRFLCFIRLFIVASSHLFSFGKILYEAFGEPKKLADFWILNFYCQSSIDVACKAGAQCNKLLTCPFADMSAT
ncbi:hypothetical protein VNO80_10347 [Phaseolus coccineus]|uniref:Uncharacterized protein n=1 Tax=Phaseolus coccineus TaxID=3886 RepID=A0AAN9N8E5_PHACN